MAKDTKTALLDSAERAARTRGFDGFSYADLAQEVGIRKASIHHHFPTKAALSAAIMKRYTQAFAKACQSIDAECATGGPRLAALINRYRAALEGGQSLCLCVSFSTSRNSLPAEVIREIVGFRQMMLAWITATYHLGGSDRSIAMVHDPAQEAAATLAMLEGAQLRARAEEDPAHFDNALGLLRSRLAL